MSDVEMDNEEKMAYDPDQDPDEKRQVRKGYRSLQKSAEDRQANPNDFTAQELTQSVQNADSLFEKVRGPQEATLDSDLLLKISNLGAQKARMMKSTGGSFDIDDFVSKLVTFMGGRNLEEHLDEDSDGGEDTYADDTPLDWDKIGRKALAKSRRVPAMGFMLGPLSVEQKKRNVGKRAKLEKNIEDLKKPQQLTEEDIVRSENETSKNVINVERILEGCGEINLFRFIVNPNDFGQSVENIFYLSFLIRDGKCALEMREGEPMIYLCEPPSPEDVAAGLKKQQMVMEFDMATWKRSIDVFNIRESKIPQRPPAKTRLGNQWVG